VREHNDGRNVYIAGFPYHVTEKQIEDLCSQYGTVSECQLICDPQTQASKGFAFIQMGSAKEGADLISALDGANVFGRVLVSRLSKRGGSRTGTPSAIPSFQTSLNPSPDPYARALQSYGEVPHPSLALPLNPSPQNPKDSNDGTNVYIGGFSTEITEKQIDEICQKYGKVVECQLIVDIATHVSKGYAFVKMSTPHEAQLLIRAMDGSTLQGFVLVSRLSSRGGSRTGTTSALPMSVVKLGAASPASGFPDPYAPYPSTLPPWSSSLPPLSSEQPSEHNDGRNVYIAGFALDITQKQLEEHCRKYGTVVNCQIIADPLTQNSKGFAFVEMFNASEGQALMNATDGSTFFGRVLVARLSRRGAKSAGGSQSSRSTHPSYPSAGRDPYSYASIRDPYYRDPYSYPYYPSGHHDPYSQYYHRPMPFDPTIARPQDLSVDTQYARF